MSSTDIRKIITSQFGELEIPQENIFIFENGLLGFEELREFVLISEEETLPFKWLISIEKPEIGFPCISPWLVDIGYDPGREFDINTDVILVIVTLGDERVAMTANLKAPVIMDVKNQSGRQVILPSDKFSPNFVIGNKNF